LLRGLFKTKNVKTFNKFQITLVVKIHTESLVPQNEPPMLNIIGWFQTMRSQPQPLSPTMLKETNSGNVKKYKKQTKKNRI
jgi:hypothetical protein